MAQVLVEVLYFFVLEIYQYDYLIVSKFILMQWVQNGVGNWFNDRQCFADEDEPIFFGLGNSQSVANGFK